ncbi:MAG: TRAP transporter small permease [Chloroflexota bacterium]|nr:TRAP transporter small permease [Chloroflexota bacterium]
MQRIGYVMDRLASFFGVFSGWLVPLMMLLVLVEVFMRYVMHEPLMLSDEFSAYMLVAISFLGLAYAQKEKKHVRIEAIVSRLPVRVSNWLRVLTLSLGFGFAVLMALESYIFLAQSFKLHLTSSSWLRVPLQGPQMTLVIGFGVLAIMLLLEVVRAIGNLRAGKSVEAGSKGLG